MSLANKYRPVDFDSTIWQSHITDILKSKIKNSQNTNHNYLFFWPRWTWKTSVARILSKAMNCLDLHDGNPCNKCANCIAINEWKTVDYVEIDAASHTSVDNIRDDILANIVYAPTQLKKKIYVIDEVHMLSKSAFNALLKTIEEPQDYLSFIFATTEVNKVPETIVSRCQVFNFKKVDPQDMIPRLQKICELENLVYEDEALALISKISEWCVRDAVKYLDQVSIFGNINVENVTNFLWVAWDSVIRDFLQSIKSWDRWQIFKQVDEIHNRWIDLIQFAKQTIMFLDQNLMDDLDFYLSVASPFSEIMSMIKYYPYPSMVYKIVLNKYLWWWNDTKIITNVSTANSKKPDPTPSIQPETAKPSPIDPTPETPKQFDDNQTKNEDILAQLIQKIDSKSLQQSLQNSVSIKEIGVDKVVFIVIDTLSKMTIEKESNRKLIEEKLSEILGKNVYLELEFQDKKDYFASQLL